jgi:SP family general alpha glucoside:H+ symporter-like MFS transporter
MELEKDKPHTEHLEHADDLRAEAIKGEEAEHAEGVLEAARTHWKAVFWALMMSMCIVMEAYDNARIGNMVGPPRAF